MKRSFRHAPFVLAVLWIGAAWYYWQSSVPLRPDRVFQYPEDRRFRGFAPNGDVMLLRVVPKDSRPDGHEEVGPIEFWRLPELKKVREAFTANDAIEWPRPDSLGRIVVIRDGKAWLADFNTGDLLEELPGAETKPCQRELFNDRLISMCDRTASVYDLTSKRVLATYPGQLWSGQIFGGLWGLHAAVAHPSGGFSTGDCTVLDVVTGQLDHRFDPLGPIKSIFVSPDGKFAVINTGTTAVVCELSSAKQLWSMPMQEFGRLRFDKDSTVLAMDVLDEQKQIRTARWRVTDGTVIDPLPPASSDHVYRNIDPKGLYAIDHKSFKKGPVAQAFSEGEHQVKRWIGTRKNPIPLDWYWVWEVRNLRADELLGVYSFEQSSDLFVPDGSGFVAITDEEYEAHRLRYYRLPPQRDWWWLVWWGLLPPAGVIALRWLKARHAK